MVHATAGCLALVQEPQLQALISLAVVSLPMQKPVVSAVQTETQWLGAQWSEGFRIYWTAGHSRTRVVGLNPIAKSSTNINQPQRSFHGQTNKSRIIPVILVAPTLAHGLCRWLQCTPGRYSEVAPARKASHCPPRHIALINWNQWPNSELQNAKRKIVRVKQIETTQTERFW